MTTPDLDQPRLDRPPLEPGPPPTEPTRPPLPTGDAPRAHAAGDRFFAWTAGLGIVRGDGWIGGVAAGLAARLRIDPLIVRGILVVIGLFGFPVLFLYAIAWALLPDLDGRIPLQEAVRGRLAPALAGIAACAVLGLVPAPLAFFIGAPTLFSVAQYGGGFTALGVLAAIVAVLLVGGLLFLIVRAAIVSPRAADPVAPVPDQRTASAASAAPDPSAAASGSGPDAAPADSLGMDAAGDESVAVASIPGPDSDGPIDAEADADAPTPDDEYAAWREQHAAWKVQEDAWRRQQQDAARIAREQARRERQERGAAFTAEASERRRIRRLTKPRTPFAFVATTLGIAVVTGALVSVTSDAELAGSLGLFVAALIVALGMVVAGIARRRSGFLAAVAVVLLAGGAAATAAPTVQAMHLGDYGISNAQSAPTWPADAPFVQPWGNVGVTLLDTGTTARPIHIEKRSGSTTVWLNPGVTLNLDITAPPWTPVFSSDQGSVDLRYVPDITVDTLADGRQHYVGTIPAIASGETAGGTTQTVVIDQQSGWIEIRQYDLIEESE